LHIDRFAPFLEKIVSQFIGIMPRFVKTANAFIAEKPRK